MASYAGQPWSGSTGLRTGTGPSSSCRSCSHSAASALPIFVYEPRSCDANAARFAMMPRSMSRKTCRHAAPAAARRGSAARGRSAGRRASTTAESRTARCRRCRRGRSGGGTPSVMPPFEWPVPSHLPPSSGPEQLDDAVRVERRLHDVELREVARRGHRRAEEAVLDLELVRVEVTAEVRPVREERVAGGVQHDRCALARAGEQHALLEGLAVGARVVDRLASPAAGTARRSGPGRRCAAGGGDSGNAVEPAEQVGGAARGERRQRGAARRRRVAGLDLRDELGAHVAALRAIATHSGLTRSCSTSGVDAVSSPSHGPAESRARDRAAPRRALPSRPGELREIDLELLVASSGVPDQPIAVRGVEHGDRRDATRQLVRSKRRNRASGCELHAAAARSRTRTRGPRAESTSAEPRALRGHVEHLEGVFVAAAAQLEAHARRSPAFA